MKRKSMECQWIVFLVLCVILIPGLTECMFQKDQEDEASMMRAEAAEDIREGGLVLALILTSQDAEENEELIKSFQKVTADREVEFLVKIPDVTWEEAQEARQEAGNFVLCDVNPIEYQMLLVNELVAEDVDVIAIHANHREALEPVLAAARSLGIRICAFEQEVSEGSCDIYTTAEDAPDAAVRLLDM